MQIEVLATNGCRFAPTCIVFVNTQKYGLDTRSRKTKLLTQCCCHEVRNIARIINSIDVMLMNVSTATINVLEKIEFGRRRAWIERSLKHMEVIPRGACQRVTISL